MHLLFQNSKFALIFACFKNLSANSNHTLLNFASMRMSLVPVFYLNFANRTIFSGQKISSLLHFLTYFFNLKRKLFFGAKRSYKTITSLNILANLSNLAPGLYCCSSLFIQPKIILACLYSVDLQKAWKRQEAMTDLPELRLILGFRRHILLWWQILWVKIHSMIFTPLYTAFAQRKNWKSCFLCLLAQS